MPREDSRGWQTVAPGHQTLHRISSGPHRPARTLRTDHQGPGSSQWPGLGQPQERVILQPLQAVPYPPIVPIPKIGSEPPLPLPSMATWLVGFLLKAPRRLGIHR